MSEIRCEQSVCNDGKLVRIHRTYLNEGDYGVGWVLDSQRKSCYSCTSSFNVFRWRHHCRKCGEIFCNTCTRNRYVIKGLVEAGGSRVCNGCKENALLKQEWDWQEGPLERAETIVPSFHDETTVAACLNIVSENDVVKSEVLEALEAEKENTKVTHPQFKSTDALEERLGLSSALDSMHKFVDRLVLNDTCDTAQLAASQSYTPLIEQSATAYAEGSSSTRKEVNIHITPPNVETMSDIASSNHTDRSIGSRVLQDIMEAGVWESSPSDDSPAIGLPNSPRSAETLGTLDSGHISVYGVDSGRVNRIMKELDENGIWDAPDDLSRSTAATSVGVKLSPPQRFLAADFDEQSPIVGINEI